MVPEHSEQVLVDAAGSGDAQALNQLLIQHRERLRRVVALRLPPRLALRVDPSDIVQETMFEAARRFPDYAKSRIKRITRPDPGLTHSDCLQCPSRSSRRTVRCLWNCRKC